MIIVINNSNKNTLIKNFVSKFKETKHPLKIPCKTKKNRSYSLKLKSKKCPKDVIELIFTFLKDNGVHFKDVKTTGDIMQIIKSGEKVDGVIISGSDLRFSFDKVPYNLILPSLIAIDYFKEKVPIYGICFGFQLLNKYFGGEIGRTNNYRKKRYNVEITRNGRFFKNSHSGKYYFYNGDSVTKIGEGFMSMTNNIKKEGLELIVEHKRYKIIGTQFHPELSGDDGIEILEAFLKLCRVK